MEYPNPDTTSMSAASVGQKLSLTDLKDKISSGVSGFGDALKNQAGAFGKSLKSAFTSSDVPKPPPLTRVELPKDTMAQSDRYKGPLVFPEAMQYYTKFTFTKSQKEFITVPGRNIITGTIMLPLPSNLKEAFSMSYTTPELGSVAGTISKAVTDSLQNDKLPGLKEMGTMAVDAAGGAALNAFKSSKIGQAGMQATGLAPNPMMAVLFDNIGFRSHQFSYRFAPRSKSESDTLKNIILQFKKASLPGFRSGGQAIFTFPMQFDISFEGFGSNPPYNILPGCVMESFDVNYAPQGSPSFFGTTEAPVFIEINMTFKETMLYTQENVIMGLAGLSDFHG